MAKKQKKINEENLTIKDNNKKRLKKSKKKNKKLKKITAKTPSTQDVNPKSLNVSDINAVYNTFLHLVNQLSYLSNEPLKYNGEIITNSEINTLRMLENGDSISIKNLANELNVTKTVLLKTINKLLHKSLISKQKLVDVDDNVVKITPEGIRVLEVEPEWSEKKKKPVIDALEKMNETELAFFNAALERIIMNTIK